MTSTLMPKDLMCQSCGLPLDSADLLGTDSKGKRISEYCIYCFYKGRFTEPNVSRDEMVERVTDHLMKTEHLAHLEAQDAAKAFIPNLKRWDHTVEHAHG